MSAGWGLDTALNEVSQKKTHFRGLQVCILDVAQRKPPLPILICRWLERELRATQLEAAPSDRDQVVVATRSRNAEW